MTNTSSLAAVESYERLPHLLLFLCAIAYCFRLSDLIASGQLTLLQLLLALGAAVAIVGFYEFSQGGFVSSARRLAIAGNIRALANTAGFVFVGSTLYFLFGKNCPAFGSAKRNTATQAIVLLSFLCISAFLMLATMSRGVLFSAFLAMVSGLFAWVFFNHRRHHRAGWMPIVGVALFVSIFVFFDGTDAADALGQRMSTLDHGKEIRYELWRSTIENMTSWQLLFGSGVASFRDFALLSGYDMYAHSVFVDTFVSFGVFGIFGLFFLVSWLAVAAFRKRDNVSLGLLVFVCCSHATHGAVNSVTFLVFLAIVAGTTHGTQRSTSVSRSFIGRRTDFPAGRNLCRRRVQC